MRELGPGVVGEGVALNVALQLARRESEFRELLDALPTAIYTTDAEGNITFFNRAAEELAARKPVLGTDKWCVTWRLWYTDGRPMPHEECPMAIALKENRAVRGAEAIVERPDGTRFPMIPYPTPLHDERGNLIGAVNMLVDISERKAAELRQKALIDELNHRVKNTLATVQSLAALTLRGDDDPSAEREKFEARLLALSLVHNQLARENWSRADLYSLLCDVLSPYGDAHPSLDGPPVALAPQSALILAMVFHELATNAVKYGALGHDEGKLRIRWHTATQSGARRLHLEWSEEGQPAAASAKQGFGSKLVVRGISQELKGTARMERSAQGIQWVMELPLGQCGAADAN